MKRKSYKKGFINFVKSPTFYKAVALFVAVIILYFAATYLAIFQVERSERFQSLTAREQAVNESILQLQNVQDLQNEINELRRDLGLISGERDDLRERVSQLENELNTLQNRPTILPYEGDSTRGGRVYLSFDDGPSHNTPLILDILAEYGVQATFFVIGTSDFHYVRRIVEEGHAVALHSYTHNYSQIYANEEAFWADIDRLNDRIYEYAGVRSNVLRFPGGSSNQVSIRHNRGIMTRLAQQVPERGKAYFDWNVDSNDANARFGNPTPPGVIFDSVRTQSARLTDAHVLMHDSNRQTTTVEALPAIIEHFLSREFTFHVTTVDTPPIHHRIAN